MQGIIKIGTALVTKGFKAGVKELKKEAVNVDKEITKILNNSTKVTKQLGNALGGVTKKAIGLGNALFNLVAVGGVMGAIGLGAFILSKALDKANGKSEQLKANLSYIGFVASKIFENLLQPAIDKTTGAVNGLVGALYKAVVYIGYILSKWSGKDLFAGTSVKDYAKSMEDAQKSAKGTAKATKQIKKDLMGFDEVNKLSDNTSANGTSGTKINLPNLPSLGDVPIPDWVKWIADHKDEILKVGAVILGILTFSKVVSWLKPLGDFFGLFSGGKLLKSMGGVKGAIKGLFTTSKPLFTGWSGFATGILASLPIIIATIDNLLEGNVEHRKQLNRLSERGLELAKEDVKEERKIEEAQDFLNYKRQQGYKVLEQSHKVGSKITGTTKEQLKNAEGVAKQDKLYIDQQMEKFRKGELTNEQQQELIDMIRNEKGYVQDVYDELDKQGIKTDEIKQLEQEYVDLLYEVAPELANQKTGLDYIQEGWDKIHGRTKDTKNNVEQATTKTGGWFDKVKGIGNEIANIATQKFPKKDLEIDVKANTKNANTALTNLIKNFALLMIKPLEAMGMSASVKMLKNMFSNLTGIKLANGGIINNPGRGVALGTNIIGGERGAEAVIPLNDETMERLGSAIAKHMNINLTNVNQMNGRTISRELKTIMNENEFTYNG